jgi:hypothetical protein
MPYQQTRTIEDLRAHGTVVSGIPSYDNDISNQMVTMMLTIDQMVEFYRRGIPVRVCDVADTKRIYESISQHIYSWKSRLEKGINIGDAPIEDLIDLDRFANAVYEHAKYEFTEETANSILAQHLGTIQRLNSTNFFNKQMLQNIKGAGDEDGIIRINQEKPKEPERDSLQDFFKSRIDNLKRY